MRGLGWLGVIGIVGTSGGWGLWIACVAGRSGRWRNHSILGSWVFAYASLSCL